MTFRGLLGRATLAAFALAAFALAACSPRPPDGSVAPTPARAAPRGPGAPAEAPDPPGAPAPAPAPAPGAPAAARVENVVLITVDSLRADQPWTTRPVASTPALNALAAKSTIYTRAYAVSNLTTSSLSAMLAGRYPSELPHTRCKLSAYKIGADALAPFLRAAGVATLAGLGHTAFVRRLVPADGFEQWRLIENARAKITEGAVTGEAIGALFRSLITKQAPRGRFFAWTHLLDPHEAYVRHAGFPPTSGDARGRYDGEVAYTDHVIAGVLDAIAASGLAERTAVIISSDHGEAFGEHGVRWHGLSTYEEEIRVPLIVYVPGRPPGRVDVPRSTLDIGPTVADLLGLAPPASWRGTSLLADLGAPSPAARPVIVDLPPLESRAAAKAVILGDRKVVFGGRGAARVYDLARDPGERSPLDGPEAERAIDEARAALAPLTEAPTTPCGGR
ncbi:MAG TPA: sulfatase [Polyangiaceae bacterium]|nr:sulfatase [Polyangiaceae bacterium]